MDTLSSSSDTIKFTKKQIIEETGLGKATFYKYWDRIVEAEMVKATRSFGKTRLYKLNEENPVIKKIIEVELALIERTTPRAVVVERRKSKSI